MQVNEVNDPTWVERKAQVEFAFKFWKFVFFSFQQIHFNPTLIIGNAQPDFYQKKMFCWYTTSITNSVADTNWPMNTEVDSIQTS